MPIRRRLGDNYGRRSHDWILQDEAPLDLVHDGHRRMLGRRHVLDGLVEIRIEWLARRLDGHNLMAAEGRLDLLGDEADPFEQFVDVFGRLGRGQRPVQVVEGGQQIAGQRQRLVVRMSSASFCTRLR